MGYDASSFKLSFPRWLLRFSRINGTRGGDTLSHKYRLKCPHAMLSHNGAPILTVDFKLFEMPLESPPSIAWYNLDPWFPIERDLKVWVIWLTPINGDFLPSFSSISHLLPPSKKKKKKNLIGFFLSCCILALIGNSVVIVGCCEAVHPVLHHFPYGGPRSFRWERRRGNDRRSRMWSSNMVAWRWSSRWWITTNSRGVWWVPAKSREVTSTEASNSAFEQV